LRDEHLVGVLSEGYFYLVDIGEQVTAKLLVRIPNEQVTTFAIDDTMSQLVLGTAQGHVYVYDLPTALENERLIARKKLDMGVEEDLVFVHFPRVHVNEVLEYIRSPLEAPSPLTASEHIVTENLPRVSPVISRNKEPAISYRMVSEPSIMQTSTIGDRQEYLNAGLSTMWAGSAFNKSNQVSIMKETSTMGGGRSAKQTL
jgi:hypothetical protein